MEFPHDRMSRLERRVETVEADFAIMKAFFVKEFPQYFAGETVLGIATDGESLGGEVLPDVKPIDLRTVEEIARGEAYHLSDLVDVNNWGAVA